MLTPEERRQRRAESQERYAHTPEGRLAREKARQTYNNSHKGFISRLGCKLRAQAKQFTKIKLKDHLRKLKQRQLQPQILAAINAGRLTTYRVDNGLYFPLLNGKIMTDPAMIDIFLRDLEK